MKDSTGMLEIISRNNDLEIIYKGNLVVNHSMDNPFILVGIGKERIKSHCGNFDIKEKLITKIPLLNYKVLEGNKVEFSYGDYAVECKFSEKNDRLEIETDYTGENRANRYWFNLHAEENEYVYGCGEQMSYFNLRGRNFPIWTSEPGVGRDNETMTTFLANKDSHSGGEYYNTYYPEPTFVSSRKYWCHADTYCYCEMNFEASDVHTLYFWGMPEFIVLEYSQSFLKLMERLTDYVGRLPELPEWLHDGMILGVQGGTSDMLNRATLARENGIEISGLWCQDWAGINKTSFGTRLYWQWQWNEDRYPDLKNVIQLLDYDDIKFMAYICPFLLKGEKLYSEGKHYGYLAMNKDGEVFDEDFGEFLCGLVDFTNPDAFEWYKGVIKRNLIDLGVKGWMADFGEYLPVDCILHNGKDAKDMHNEWPVLWAKCNYEAVKESGKLSEVIYFMRAGGHGSQRYSLSLWAGDQSVNWDKHDGIPSVIPAALSSGIIGNPYTHSDIGGYTSLYGNVRTKELFERWCEMSVFSSYMRTHEGNRPEQNFQFYDDVNTMQLMAKMTQIRVSLKPYIVDVVKEGSEKGYPMQRPIFFHYEDDCAAYTIQDEYLFGSDMLTAPVVEPNQKQKKVHLPDDNWIHIWTGDEYNGGTITVDCPIGYPPVFYRKNSKYAEVFVKTSSLNRL